MKSQKGMVEDLIAAVLGVVIILVMAFGGWMIKEYKCANYEDMTGMPTKYKIFDGCYVKTDKGWFLKEQLRDIQVK